MAKKRPLLLSSTIRHPELISEHTQNILSLLGIETNNVVRIIGGVIFPEETFIKNHPLVIPKEEHEKVNLVVLSKMPNINDFILACCNHDDILKICCNTHTIQDVKLEHSNQNVIYLWVKQ